MYGRYGFCICELVNAFAVREWSANSNVIMFELRVRLGMYRFVGGWESAEIIN